MREFWIFDFGFWIGGEARKEINSVGDFRSKVCAGAEPLAQRMDDAAARNPNPKTQNPDSHLP
jgi:hypothetical protein